MLILMLIQVILGVITTAGRPPNPLEIPTANNIADFLEMNQSALGSEASNLLIKKNLSKKALTCNDGSPSGFYHRASSSNRWIVYLEGGWYCYDHRSCHDRWMNQRHLMSSKLWPPTRTVGGILSANPTENSLYWNANHVLVPYCTSDIWSGTRRHGIAGSRFSFLGARIVRQVVIDLLPLGLTNGSTLLLVGSSAGGTGVLLNLNSVKNLVHNDLNLDVAVRGMADSGWFLDREPYSVDQHAPIAADAITLGVPLWQAKVPPHCAANYPFEPWRCYFGYRIYPFLEAPLFIFQWLFDEAQMTADNVGPPVTKHQWDYIHKMGDSLRHSFKSVRAVFAPSCIGHCVLTKTEWQSVKINGVSLPEAMRTWELGLDAATRQQLFLLPNSNVSSSPSTMLADAPLSTGPADVYKTVEEAPQGRKRRKHKRKNGEARGSGRKKRKGQGRKKQNRLMRSAALSAIALDAQSSAKDPVWHHIGRCSWPQCNPSCPKLHNPYTGEEMDFIDLLKSFGLDMASVADALGVDIPTLNNMDHEQLLKMLTQQSN